MASSETGSSNSRVSGSLWDMTGHEQVITFIGAGGKTTCLRSLTQEIDSAGHQVIATTTTKVFPEESMKGWKNPNPPPHDQEGACFWYVDVIEETGKWIGPTVQAVDAAIASQRTVPNLHTIAADLHSKRFWVIEGDGARGRKLKCWAPHEPQIPERTECAVLVLDRGLWGNVLLADQAHRWERCQNLLGQIWNAEKAWNYFMSSPVFAPQYGHMAWVILLNSPSEKVENEVLKETEDPLDPLENLSHRWAEIRREAVDLKNWPRHLRLAVGDAKEGKIQWCDLW